MKKYTMYICSNYEQLLPSGGRYEFFSQNPQEIYSFIDEAIDEAIAKNELPESLEWEFESDFRFWNGGYAQHCTGGHCVVGNTAPKKIIDFVRQFNEDFDSVFYTKIEEFIDYWNSDDLDDELDNDA